MATRTGVFDDVDDEIGQPTELYWDDIVDVVCAGTGPGALAQAILCTDLGLDVEFAERSPFGTVRSRYGGLPGGDDRGPGNVGPADPQDSNCQSFTPNRSPSERIAARDRAVLRVTVRDCPPAAWLSVASSTASTRGGVTAMRATQAKRSGRPCSATIGLKPTVRVRHWPNGWASRRGAECRRARPGLHRLVFEWGRVAGAAIATPDGTRLVRARAGVALSAHRCPTVRVAGPIGVTRRRSTSRHRESDCRSVRPRRIAVES